MSEIYLTSPLMGARLAAANRVLRRYGYMLSPWLDGGPPLVRDAVNLLGRRPGVTADSLIESLNELMDALEGEKVEV